MKEILRRTLLLLSLAVVSPAMAQGTIAFNTRWGAVDAPVIYLGDNLLADDQFLAQLYAGLPEGRLEPIGVPHPFRSDEGRGYVSAGSVEVPGIPPGSMAQVQMAAWAVSLGNSYEEARVRGDGNAIGKSDVIVIQLGGGVVPAAPLLGLKGFKLNIVPEPSAISLVVVGCGALMVYRRSMRRRMQRVIGCMQVVEAKRTKACRKRDRDRGRNRYRNPASQCVSRHKVDTDSDTDPDAEGFPVPEGQRSLAGGKAAPPPRPPE